MTSVSDQNATLEVPLSLDWARPTDWATRCQVWDRDRRPRAEAGRFQFGGSTTVTADHALEQSLAGDVDSLLTDLGVDHVPWHVSHCWTQSTADPSSGTAVDWWYFLVGVVRAARETQPIDRPLRALYDRAAFMLLSLPFRPGHESLLTSITKEEPASFLALQARQARLVWAQHLDGLVDHHILGTLDDDAIDEELDALIWATPIVDTNRNSKQDKALLTLTAPGTPGSSPPLTATEGFLRWASRRLLLPRLRVIQAWRIDQALARGQNSAAQQQGDTSKHPDSRLGHASDRLATLAVPGAYGLMLMLLIASVADLVATIPLSPLDVMNDTELTTQRGLIAGIAVIPYVLVALGTMKRGAAIAYPAMLRFPAISLLGGSVIMALGTFWYTEQHWWLSATLFAAAFGYLFFEAKNHRVAKPMRRVAGVLTAGALHGFTVSVLWLALARDIFLSAVECAAQPNAPLCAPIPQKPFVQPADILGTSEALVFADLALMTSVGLMLGMALQLLWDEQPVTYPLIHLGGS